MMERDFFNDEFEDLIRQKTDQYKLYPSDKVWKNIYNSIHTRRRRFIVGMSFLITGILFIAGKELLMPGNHPAIAGKSPAENVSLDKASDKKGETDAVSNGFSILKIPSTPQKLLSAAENKLAVASLAEETTAGDQTDIAVAPIIPLYIQKEGPEQQVVVRPGGSAGETSNGLIENFAMGSVDAISTPPLSAATVPAEREIKRINSIGHAPNRQDAEDLNEVNWLEQTASFELKNPIKNGSRVNWQVYMSPTVNYRTLSGGDPFTVPKSGVQYVPIALTHSGSPNDYVIHKAAIGYEAGGSLLYRVSRNLTLKAGLQFNYSRYDIKAYTTANSQQATIALNSLSSYYSNVISGLTNIQTFGGNQITDLYNHYYQLSAPVGFELRIFGNERIQFNIAATIQPSYLINRNNYLLTTDYSDYTKAPSLFRKWNFDGGVEAFVSYKIAGLRWQVGPQLRYQLLSTYTTQYPIRENLKEYGLKIGVSKTIW
jgi:hypothetical protein